jgi:hypothetical protein
VFDGILTMSPPFMTNPASVRIIACIEDPQFIEKILRHLGLGGSSGRGRTRKIHPLEPSRRWP